jgi:hypothetical protein
MRDVLPSSSVLSSGFAAVPMAGCRAMLRGASCALPGAASAPLATI